jgi:hypothetical protein
MLSSVEKRWEDALTNTEVTDCIYSNKNELSKRTHHPTKTIKYMKRLFFFLLRKYSNTEEQRIKIYRELWYKLKDEYSEQNAFGNVYNMNTEVLLSNPFFESRVLQKDAESLKMLKSGLSNSFDLSVKSVLKEKK